MKTPPETETLGEARCPLGTVWGNASAGRQKGSVRPGTQREIKRRRSDRCTLLPSDDGMSEAGRDELSSCERTRRKPAYKLLREASVHRMILTL